MSPTDPACEEGEDPLGPEDLLSSLGVWGGWESQVSPQLWFLKPAGHRPTAAGPEQAGSCPKPPEVTAALRGQALHMGLRRGTGWAKWGGVSGNFKFNPRF